MKKNFKPNQNLNCSTNLGYYLAGLIEGDGYFGKNKLEIAFSDKDKNLALKLINVLGCGAIYPYSQSRKAFRLVFSNKAALQYVVKLCNGKFVSPAKVNQMHQQNYENKLNIQILPPLLKISLDNYWLSGFIEADGSLGIFIANSKTHFFKKSVRLEVKIAQNFAFKFNCTFISS
jgi:hypothetical protein